MYDNEATPLISSPYHLDKQILSTIVSKYKERKNREEVDYLDRICSEDQITALLNVNPAFGIDPSEIEERKRIYGSENGDKGASVGTFGAILLDYYIRYLIPILIILCIFVGTIHVVRGREAISLVLSNSFFTAAVCFIYMISTMIIRYFSHRGEGKKLTEAMESLKITQVYRNKNPIKVHYSELVTGDIISLKKGMFVPADILVLESQDLAADEFRYTNQRDPKFKSNLVECKAANSNDIGSTANISPSPVLLGGSYIISGEGKGIVLVAGAASSLSHLPKTAYSYTGTNIQLKMEVAGIGYMYMGIKIVIVFLIVLEARYFISDSTANWAEISIWYLIYTVGILTFITIEDLILILHDIIGTSIKSLLGIGVLPKRFLAFDGAPFITDICLDKHHMDKEVEAVKKSLSACATAGVRIKVVTEEHFAQAREVVMTCGLINPESEGTMVVEASEFEKKIQEAREMDNDEADNSFLWDVKVIVSSRPQDKEFLIYALQENKSIVAFVGRTNEDLAIMSKANISFTLASAPDMLKDNADFILIKEDFSNIVEVIKWGRNIYENMTKYFQFRAPTIISTLGITLVGAAACRDPILKPVHLIWILLLIELSARLLLAGERPNKEIMKYKTLHNPYGSIVTTNMKKHIIGQAIYQMLVVFVLLFTAEYWIPDNSNERNLDDTGHVVTYSVNGYIRPGRPYAYNGDDDEYAALEDHWGASRHFTLIFNTYALMVLINIVNCRTLRDELNFFKGTSDNIKFVCVLIIVGLIHFAIGNFTGAVFGVSPMGLTSVQWLIALMFGLGSLVVSFILRLFTTKEENNSKLQVKIF